MGQKGLKTNGTKLPIRLVTMVLLRRYTPTSPQTQSFQVQLNAALISNVMLPSVGLTCTTCQCAIHTLSQNKSSSCRTG